MIKIYLYLLTIPLSMWTLEAININGLFKKNRVLQIKVLFVMLSLSLAYLFTSFLYDFSTNMNYIK
jgi:uncharacterized integral membrane protein (TIGR02327 family)